MDSYRYAWSGALLGVISFKSVFQDQPLLADLLIGPRQVWTLYVQPATPVWSEIRSHFGGETGCINVKQAEQTSFKIIYRCRIDRWF
jgi:hypothetical protein